jgi:pimeloyl-ACP methyl ester carboxylesterase
VNPISPNQEIKIELYPNQHIAAQKYGNSGLPVLAIHGWLDNSSSFERLIPLLTPELQICAVDLPGHGFSSHKPEGQYFHMTDVVIDLFRFADLMGWKTFALLGHSLGACIASLMAGTFPDRIKGVALIDGLGPLTGQAEDSPKQLKKAISGYVRLASKKLRDFRFVEEAILARMQGATALTEQAAKILLQRGLTKTASGWQWSTDPKLLLPTPDIMTEDQALYFLSEITAPTCLIRPKEGYPFPLARMQTRMHQLKLLSVIEVPGNHHVHLEQPELVAPHLNAFFNSIVTE